MQLNFQKTGSGVALCVGELFWLLSCIEAVAYRMGWDMHVRATEAPEA